MEQSFLICNRDDSCVEDFLLSISKSCDEIYLAIAYFSNRDIVDIWLQKKIKLSCLVALQPPTDPALLRHLLPLPPSQVELKFYDSRFHSKSYIFLKRGKPIGALVGSSNLTNGGLSGNIESNVFITEPYQTAELLEQFKQIWETAASLSPEDVRNYERTYSQIMKDLGKANTQHSKFERRFVIPRLPRHKPRIRKEGMDYYGFWKCVDDVRSIVGKEAQREWPRVPVYLAIDHFWHWIVKVWDRANIRRIKSDRQYRRKVLPLMFREFIEWDKSESVWTSKLNLRSKWFRSLLSPKVIQRLTRRDARDIYSSLYSGGMRTQRFYAHESFAKDNSIEKIRYSLAYLLHSSDDVARRISALLVDEKYKLEQFGASNIQELLGWVFPNVLPIRNDKANKAVEMLGYRFR